MIVKPKFKNFVCVNAHPYGCKKNILTYINRIKPIKNNTKKNVLIIGASSGYGLISRLISTFKYGYNTIGIFNEKMPTYNKTGSAGWYNTAFLEDEAKLLNVYTKSFNNDAFSINTINSVINFIKKKKIKIDLLIYSLATSKYYDEENNKIYKSTIKPVRKNIITKTIDIEKNIITNIILKKATLNEIRDTKFIMGGYLWNKWINILIKHNLINNNFKTIAYSYASNSMTSDIYKNGTIGFAKNNLYKFKNILEKKLTYIFGNAFISFNEAILTQSSMVIPSVPLYLAILDNIKTKKNIIHDELNYINDLFIEINNNNSLINLNTFEQSICIENKIDNIWKIINTENMYKYIDIKTFTQKYLNLYGFGYTDINYNLDVNPIKKIISIK